jgi:predicted ATPase/DNA-binding SARP family transcriptional activator/DNA-binding CsgD family transcriptional regulator
MYPPAGLEYEKSRGERPEAMRIWLLGGFNASIGQRTIGGDAWRLRKAAALVKLLALAPGHRMHREQAITLLWHDSGRKAGSNNLRKTLHDARRSLHPGDGSRYLVSEDESLVLCPKSELWVDVDAFEEAAAAARRSQDPAAYRAAIDLWTGELLPGDRYEEWAQERREQLRRLYLDLLVELAKLHEGRGEDGPAIEALRTAVAIEPSLEQAHVDLMRLHAVYGRRGEALAQYERLQETLRRKLGADPDASVRALREEIAAGRFPSPEQPSIRTAREEPLDAGKHNLPATRTSFVGRDHELKEINRALTMSRLLTLTGAGGSGKTRLALEVAREHLSIYPDGVWLAELAGLSEGDLIPQAVATSLRVLERPGEPLTETLIEALRDKELLLVMDNCEHLVDEAARLVDTLLASCPRLRVLATSREPLAVPGEVNLSVPPLSLPATTGEATAEALMSYEAVRLFVDRARLRLPGFEVTREDAQVVARVCRKLDGIPLAIELATARMGALALEQVAQRLEVTLDVLGGGSRTAAARQRTLRATLDWSHDLLSENERALFRRFSVFAGGWTLEAAEAVCPGGGIDEDEVLDILGGLVDKSLVVAGTEGGGAVRYRMLEPVRQYATEKLEESGEADDVLDQLAEFFVILAEEAESALLGANQGVWLDRLQTEHDNIRAVFAWALGNGDKSLGLRLAGALVEYWMACGLYDEGRGWPEALLAEEGEADALTQAKALETVGWLAQEQGDFERADEAANEGLDLAAEAELRSAVKARFLRILETAAFHRGDYERTRELAERSLALSREAEDRRGIAWSLTSLAGVASAQGDGKRALELSVESLALARELGGTDLGHMLLNSGYEFLLQGDYERAMALNEEAAALAREQGDKYRLHYSLDNLGWAALMRGDHRHARASFRENLVLCQELHDKLIASESLEGLACILGARRNAERTAKLFGAAETLREAVGFSQSSAQRALREPYLAAARSQLDEAAWEAAFAEGQKMTFEEAVEYALASEERSLTSTPVPKKSLADEQAIVLTRREEEIAVRVAQGLTNRQIATELMISEHTAATHVRRVLKKLGLRSRAQIGSWLTDRSPTADPN